MPGSPFLSKGPFPVSADWLSAGSLIGSTLSSTELGSEAGRTAVPAAGSGEQVRL